ncbi:ATP-dependent endonuclease [Leuconostoc sp. MS02]|uniref:ATP-dependent endonuclease n=1 Tax=Leuconostoc aquikimchii TaxID=3236804 RepID=A0ABV3S2N1_9LACO
MTKLDIIQIELKNFRSIKYSNLYLKKDNIIVGKNNIGKTSIIEAFNSFNSKLSLKDINIDLLIKIMENRNSPSRITQYDSIEIVIKYSWQDLPVDYWKFLSEISSSGETVVKISYSIPEENHELLKDVLNVKELLELFTKKVYVGSADDFEFGREKLLPINKSFIKFLPQSQSRLKNVQKGEIIMFPIMAFRFVDRGKLGNQEATESQFSEKFSTMISKNEDVEDVFLDLQNQINQKVTPKMKSLQSDLKSFAYPSNPENPLKAILTIDEWFENPKVRIAQTFKKLSNFELPLNAQGLGYQNIYNIIARVSASFSQMKNLGLKNPVFFVIEEPEAFTHPQLQHIFIQQISEFIEKQASELDIPYQLTIISHSPEMAVSSIELDFELIIGRQINNETKFINWNSLGGESQVGRDKLKKLILNYNAEMLFADKLIAYEGNAEKIMLTAMIRKNIPKLLSEKIAFIPVGTYFSSYESVISDLYYDKVLLITDIDYKQTVNISDDIDKNRPIRTTNNNLKYLFDSSVPTLTELDLSELIQQSKESEYIHAFRKMTPNRENASFNFQIVTQGWNKKYNFLPRTLESAMVTKSKLNMEMYKLHDLIYDDVEELAENNPYCLNDVEKKLLKKGKADFALQSLDLISNTDFQIPTYLTKGLEWLAK